MSVTSLTFQEAHRLYMAKLDLAFQAMRMCLIDPEHLNKDSKEYQDALANFSRTLTEIWALKSRWAEASKLEKEMIP